MGKPGFDIDVEERVDVLTVVQHGSDKIPQERGDTDKDTKMKITHDYTSNSHGLPTKWKFLLMISLLTHIKICATSTTSELLPITTSVTEGNKVEVYEELQDILFNIDVAQYYKEIDFLDKKINILIDELPQDSVAKHVFALANGDGMIVFKDYILDSDCESLCKNSNLYPLTLKMVTKVPDIPKVCNSLSIQLTMSLAKYGLVCSERSNPSIGKKCYNKIRKAANQAGLKFYDSIDDLTAEMQFGTHYSLVQNSTNIYISNSRACCTCYSPETIGKQEKDVIGEIYKNHQRKMKDAARNRLKRIEVDTQILEENLALLVYNSLHGSGVIEIMEHEDLISNLKSSYFKFLEPKRGQIKLKEDILYGKLLDLWTLIKTNNTDEAFYQDLSNIRYDSLNDIYTTYIFKELFDAGQKINQFLTFYSATNTPPHDPFPILYTKDNSLEDFVFKMETLFQEIDTYSLIQMLKFFEDMKAKVSDNILKLTGIKITFLHYKQKQPPAPLSDSIQIVNEQIPSLETSNDATGPSIQPDTTTQETVDREEMFKRLDNYLKFVQIPKDSQAANHLVRIRNNNFVPFSTETKRQRPKERRQKQQTQHITPTTTTTTSTTTTTTTTTTAANRSRNQSRHKADMSQGSPNYNMMSDSQSYQEHQSTNELPDLYLTEAEFNAIENLNLDSYRGPRLSINQIPSTHYIFKRLQRRDTNSDGFLSIQELQNYDLLSKLFGHYNERIMAFLIGKYGKTRFGKLNLIEFYYLHKSLERALGRISRNQRTTLPTTRPRPTTTTTTATTTETYTSPEHANIRNKRKPKMTTTTPSLKSNSMNTRDTRYSSTSSDSYPTSQTTSNAPTPTTTTPNTRTTKASTTHISTTEIEDDIDKTLKNQQQMTTMPRTGTITSSTSFKRNAITTTTAAPKNIEPSTTTTTSTPMSTVTFIPTTKQTTESTTATTTSTTSTQDTYSTAHTLTALELLESTDIFRNINVPKDFNERQKRHTQLKRDLKRLGMLGQDYMEAYKKCTNLCESVGTSSAASTSVIENNINIQKNIIQHRTKRNILTPVWSYWTGLASQEDIKKIMADEAHLKKNEQLVSDRFFNLTKVDNLFRDEIHNITVHISTLLNQSTDLSNSFVNMLDEEKDIEEKITFILKSLGQVVHLSITVENLIFHLTSLEEELATYLVNINNVMQGISILNDDLFSKIQTHGGRLTPTTFSNVEYDVYFTKGQYQVQATYKTITHIFKEYRLHSLPFVIHSANGKASIVKLNTMKKVIMNDEREIIHPNDLEFCEVHKKGHLCNVRNMRFQRKQDSCEADIISTIKYGRPSDLSSCKEQIQFVESIQNHQEYRQSTKYVLLISDFADVAHWHCPNKTEDVHIEPLTLVWIDIIPNCVLETQVYRIYIQDVMELVKIDRNFFYSHNDLIDEILIPTLEEYNFTQDFKTVSQNILEASMNLGQERKSIQELVIEEGHLHANDLGRLLLEPWTISEHTSSASSAAVISILIVLGIVIIGLLLCFCYCCNLICPIIKCCSIPQKAWRTYRTAKNRTEIYDSFRSIRKNYKHHTRYVSTLEKWYTRNKDNISYDTIVLDPAVNKYTLSGDNTDNIFFDLHCFYVEDSRGLTKIGDMTRLPTHAVTQLRDIITAKTRENERQRQTIIRTQPPRQPTSSRGQQSDNSLYHNPTFL